MPEGLTAAEVGKEIGEHRQHVAAHHDQRDRLIAIFEAVLLSIVALLAAWPGYSAAKWGTEGSVSFFRLAVRRLRPGYRPAFTAWLALHPLKNPHAPADPSYLPQYRIPQQAQGEALAARADGYFEEGVTAAETADKYVRLTVLLAAVLFLVGIGSRFPVRAARYGLVSVAGVLLVVSVVQLLGLPGPPS